MSNHDEALFCNDAFYQAFLGRDMPAMNKVWARDFTILCIHPGGQALSGRHEVITSWQRILAHATCPRIIHKVDKVVSYDDLVLITCYEWDERRPDNLLLATNGFSREGDRYKMVFHQAGPTPIGPLERDVQTTKPLH